MDHAHTWNAPAASRPSTIARYAWLGTLAAAVCWWAVVWRQAADFRADLASTEGLPLPIPALITITVAGRFAGLVAEALFYWTWWRSWGAPFRFGRFFHTLALISLVDAWAVTLRALVRDVEDGGRTWLAPLLGIDLLHDGPPGAVATVWVAFGSLSLLTAVRIWATAAAQRRETGRTWSVVLGITIAAWTVTRIITWWTFDLARGASPLPGVTP
jgi:hypothetical protein